MRSGLNTFIKCQILVFALTAVSSCSFSHRQKTPEELVTKEPIVSFKLYNYDTNESAHFNVRGLKGYKIKASPEKFYFNKSIKFPEPKQPLPEKPEAEKEPEPQGTYTYW